MSSKYFVSCYDQKTHELNHFEVDFSVYVYIKQLENAIIYGPAVMESVRAFYAGRLDERPAGFFATLTDEQKEKITKT